MEGVREAAALIAEQYVLNGAAPTPGIAGARLAAILSDALLFASPACSEKDRRKARWLAEAAGVDADELGRG